MSKRKILVAAMSAAMILSVALGVGVANASNEVTLGDNDYSLSEAFDVRLSYNGEGQLNVANNGLRAKAKISAEDYAELNKLTNETTVIKYGILVAPTEYVTENALTAENVFGENRVYATSAAEEAEDRENNRPTKRIECAEESELTEGEDGYYLYCVLSDLGDEAVMRGYTAKAYTVKYTIGEYGMISAAEYAFKDDEKEINPVYAVQKAIEAGKVSSYNEDLVSAYINGKYQKITVEYVTSYDGADPSAVSNEYDFAVGSTITKDDVLAKLTGVDPSAYDMTTEFTSQKVYAGVNNKISFAFSPKKAESSAAAIGMYLAGEDSVEIKENALSCKGHENVAYSLFRDGTVVIDGANGKEILGKVDFGAKKFVMGGKTLSQVLELDEEIYAKVGGYYLHDGKIVKLNADGTGVYDLLGDGANIKYLLTYDELNGRYVAAFKNSLVKTLTLGETAEIADFTAVKLGSEADYNNLADYYLCTTDGDNLNKIYRLNVDGSIVENGAEVGAFVLLDNGTISANIGGNVYSATLTSSNVNGATVKTIALSGNNGALTLKCDSLANYSELTEKVNNLFGNTELIFEGSEAGDGVGKPRVRLTTETSIQETLATVKLPDGTSKWKHAQYGSTGWGYFFPEGLSYFAEQTSPTGGLIHFRRNAYPEADQKLVKYEVKDGKMSIDMTDYDPNGTGQATQFQVLYADIGTDADFGNTYTNMYEVFGSRFGTHYFPTDYKVAGATASTGGFVLYNYHTAISGMESEWYMCEFWANTTGWIQPGFENTTIAYKLDFDTVKNVGKLTIGRADGARWEYTIGIVNGNKFIDMRVNSLAGYDGFDNVKVAVSENAARDIAAIEYAITTANKTFVNAGATTSAPVDTRTVYEKIAGTYKTGSYYNETDNWWWGIGLTLNADGTMVMTHDASQTGTYEIREITDTFGEIIIDCPYPIVARDGVIHTGYYALIDGQYVLRLTNCAMNCAKWAFWDFAPAGCTFTTWSVFDELVGEGTSYTDGNATLTLNKLGAKPDESKEDYTGAKFTLTDGDVTISGNYDLVPVSHGAGKLFMDITTEPEASRYIIGDYKLVGENYVLVFTINTANLSKTYMMSVGSLDGVYNQVRGTYFGAENIEFTSAAEVSFSSITEGTISENGITASFFIEDGRIKITYTKNGLDFVAMK